MVACNTTLEDEAINETPLWDHGLTFHHVGLIISAVFGLISVFVSLFLILQHARHYSKPWEQKHIIRILFMIPIYSTVSFLSYQFYKHAIYFEVLRDCYEAFAIASFLALLCHYIAPNLHEQKEYFRSVTPLNWFWGVFGLQKLTGGKDKGILRIPRSGLTWFNVIWASVFQYCLIRVLFTIVSVVTQYFNRYCEASNSPAFAKIWVEVFEAASVTVAMFCLIQFYIQLKGDLADHRPFLKVICIKLVIFFSFWQSLAISFASSSKGPLQATDKINYPDIKIGMPAMLLCIEMSIFSVMHLFVFPWKPYDTSKLASDPLAAPGNGFSGSGAKYHGGPFGLLALADAFNPWDIVKASARGFRWIFVGRKRRFDDPSYTGVTTKPSKVNGLAPTTYNGPSYASTSDPATELEQGRGRADTAATDSDTAGLLSHAQSNSPSRPTAPIPARDPSHAETDLGDPHQAHMHTHSLSPPMPSAFGGFDNYNTHPPQDDFDTGYHAPVGAASVQRPPIGMAHGGSPGEWDMWAGATRDADGAESTRPPTYRTHG